MLNVCLYGMVWYGMVRYGVVCIYIYIFIGENYESGYWIKIGSRWASWASQVLGESAPSLGQPSNQLVKTLSTIKTTTTTKVTSRSNMIRIYLNVSNIIQHSGVNWWKMYKNVTFRSWKIRMHLTLKWDQTGLFVLLGFRLGSLANHLIQLDQTLPFLGHSARCVLGP